MSAPTTNTTESRNYNIVLLPGDYAGPEVTAEAVKVLRCIDRNIPHVTLNLQPHLLGGASIDAHGVPLTDDALNACKSADAILLGAIGGPKYSHNATVRPEQGILKLRKELDTFGNLRPCFFASPTLAASSPLKAEICEGVDFMIVRELTGGIYFGERTEGNPADGEQEWAEDREPYSRREIERVTRLAGHLALAKNPPSKVWSLDKANVLATSRLWRRVVTEVMQKEFPMLEFEHQLIDSAAMIMVKSPRKLNGVIVTSNLFGDIISDEASVIPGSLGLLPSASLSALPDGKGRCNGIYEPIHGSAPDIAGTGVINPVAAILSVGMMLLYSLGMARESVLVDQAVRLVIEEGIKTRDIGGSSSTSEVGDAVVKKLDELFKGL